MNPLPQQTRRWAMIWGLAMAYLALAAGCTVGPDYHRPAAVATMPATYAGATSAWKVASPQAHLSKGAWWKVFGDAKLNCLEAEVVTANQDLKAAAARFAQARAVAYVARSGLFPRIGLSSAAIRQSDSANRPLSQTGQAADEAHTYNNFTVPFDFSYELDLWGRVRRSVEFAQAGMEADVADLEGVKLAISAEVAIDYFTLRALDEEKAVLLAGVETYRKSLELTRNRRAGGIATNLDVAQAETVLKTVRAQLPAIDLTRAKFEHALATLTGQPAPLFRQADHPLAGEPPIIPAELPSALLERRPDIAAAERRMVAANAEIGVATAAFYPIVRLNGLAGLQSLDAGTVFNWSSRFWAVGPSLSLPLFEGGKRQANLRLAKAVYAETVADYRGTVLRAFSEVEDNLSAQRLLRDEYDQQRSALKSAHKQLEIANNQYRGGLVTYLQVATAQTTALQLESAVAQLRGQRFAAAVALVKSVGGDWRVTDSGDEGHHPADRRR